MIVHIANVIFNKEQRILKKGSQSRNIEPKVFNLLITLLAANGQIVTRDQLIIEVWNNRVVGEGAINRTVSLLRGHFLALTDENIIETVPTQGYRLIAKVVDSVDQQPIEIENNKTIVIKKQTTIRPINIKNIGSIAIALLVILTVFLYFYKTEDLNSNNLTLVSSPFIGLKGLEYKLSATESGQKILFHHLDEKNQQSVYLYDTEKHTKRVVLNDALAAINANGGKIVYSTQMNNQCSIGLYHVLTKQKQTLFSCSEPPNALAWGPNDTFYFNKRFSKSHPYQVFSYNVNTSQLRQITNPSSKNNTKGDFKFTYSRNHSQLAIIRYINEKKSKIIIIQDELQLNEYTVDLRINNLVWHPSTDSLVIADDSSLYTLTKTNSQFQLLKQLELKINSLVVIPSETGSSLLVSSFDIRSEIVKYDIEKARHTIWQQSARTELLPRMQADTQLILSTRYKQHHWWQIKNNEARLIDIKLPFDLQFVRYEISGDGKRVLFTKHDAVFELDLEKKVYQQLFPELKNSYVANYDTRNKNNIIYSGNHSGQWQLWLYQRATGEHSQLTQHGGYSGRVIGQYLYYSKFTIDGLWRKKLTEPTEELVIADFNRINWLNWHIINNKLYFYREATGIWQFNIETGTEQLLMERPNDFVHQYSVSPNQQYILWVRRKAIEGDIYQYTF